MTNAKQRAKEWAGLRQWGDVQDLLKLTKASRSTLYRLFYTGESGNKLLIKKVEAYYNKRREQLSASDEQLLDQD